MAHAVRTAFLEYHYMAEEEKEKKKKIPQTKDLLAHFKRHYKKEPEKAAEIGMIKDVGAETTHYWDTGNYVLNYNIAGNMLDGGWLGGKANQCAGLTQTGKSLLGSAALSLASHKKDVWTVAMDSERALEKSIIHRLHGDDNNILYLPVHTIESVMNHLQVIVEKKSASDTDNLLKVFILVDSFANLSSEEEVAQVKKHEMSKQDMGKKAKGMKKFFRVFGDMLYKHNITVLGTNHLIANVGVTHGPQHKRSGGEGFNYFSSCTMDLLTPEKTDMDGNKIEAKKGNEVIQTVVRYKMNKVRDKGAREGRVSGVTFHYEKGVDRWSGMAEHLLKYSIVVKNGRSYDFSFGGKMFHEKAQWGTILKTLQTDHDLFKAINDELYNRVLDHKETENMNEEFVIKEKEVGMEDTTDE